MLYWTTATSAALGVLAVILLLVSASQGIPVRARRAAAATPEEFLASSALVQAEEESEESAVHASVRVSDLQFASNILNPCPSDPVSGRLGSVVSEDRREEFAVEFYRTISDNAYRYRQDAQQMLNQNIIHECATFNVPILQNTPTLQELEASGPSDALVAIYASVLRHTAHSYFIRHQHQTYANVSCSDVIDSESTVSKKSGELAVKQKFLACIIRMGAAAMGYPEDYHNIAQQIVQEKLSDLRLCSRRALRDCQVLRSVIHLLGIVHDYAYDKTKPER